MPERINAAHRLDQVLREAQAYQHDMPTLEVWSHVFRVDDPDDLSTAIEVARLVGLVRDQMDEVHLRMGDTSVRPQRYETALAQLSNALKVNNLVAGWGNYKQYLKIEYLDAVSWCADTIPAEEETIAPEEWATFRDDVREFEERITASDLPDYVKAFVSQQVSIIEQAIREYPVTGARAFKRGYFDCFYNFTENQEIFQERQDEEEMQELRSLWSRLHGFAQKAGPWIAIGQAAAKVFELTGGN